MTAVERLKIGSDFRQGYVSVMQHLPALYSVLLGFQASLLRVDYDPPVKRPLTEQIKGMFTGRAGIPSIFDFKYLIYWIELLVFFQIILLALYVAYSLNLFKRGT